MHQAILPLLFMATIFIIGSNLCCISLLVFIFSFITNAKRENYGSYAFQICQYSVVKSDAMISVSCQPILRRHTQAWLQHLCADFQRAMLSKQATKVSAQTYPSSRVYEGCQCQQGINLVTLHTSQSKSNKFVEDY